MQCLSGFGRTVFWCQHHHEDICGFSIERAEVDAGLGTSEANHDITETRHVAVGNRDAVTDCGRRKCLSIQQYFDELVVVDTYMRACNDSRQLSNDARLLGRRQLRNYQLTPNLMPLIASGQYGWDVT